ncbi:MAG TPA: nitroreductase family deazaflavin-dependent oxidoreductase [Acidimicrobiales bacterium]|nr:nitroreductase family deazaflavin-dependent oxidoreductase [Acidimicrobiales bacterium]
MAHGTQAEVSPEVWRLRLLVGTDPRQEVPAGPVRASQRTVRASDERQSRRSAWTDSGFSPLHWGMALNGEYEASPWEWVRDQVEEYESSGGEKGNTLRDTGLPVVIVTTRGNKSAKVRKMALMRVEHDGEYALVASMGGAPKNPVWYHNIKAHPADVRIQDGPEPFDVEVREVEGDERAVWWERAVAAYPPYAEYQTKTERRIPVLVATRR